MKIIWGLFAVFLVFGFWNSSPVQPVLLGENVIEQQGVPWEGDGDGGIPLSDWCCVVWAQGVEPRRRRKPYRNPWRRLRKLMRRLAKERRCAVCRAQRMAHRKAEAVFTATTASGQISPAQTAPASMNELAVIAATRAEEQVVKRKKSGRPATIPTNHVFCPVEGCRGYGRLGPHPDHRIVGCGTYKTDLDQKKQMYRCEWCHQRFSETQGTVFFGLKTKEETVYRALANLAEGMSIRSTARVFGVEVETVLLWLKRAGEHCEAVSGYLMRNLQVEQAQLDELWTFVHKKEKKLSAWEKIHTEYGDTWIWTVVDPFNKLVLAFLIGDREEEQAEGVLRRLVATLLEGCLPLLTSDHLPHYAQAILKVMGRWVQPERRGSRGRFPKKRLEPSDGVQYAIVHKEHRKGRVVSVDTRVVFGKKEELLARLHSLGMKKINTSFVERMNLTLRHMVSRLRRKGLTFSKKRKFLEGHLQLAVAYYHLVRTHRGLRQRLSQAIPTKGNGSPKQWQMRTPAMSAGLTDHIWTIQELLMFRVPTASTAGA
jgi:IS1 family transposase